MSNNLKEQVQRVLKRIGLYGRIKHSVLYDLYWRIADPGLISRRQREVRFFRTTLAEFRPGNVIFGIGANIGHKTDIFLRLGARVVAVEADRSNQEILKHGFLKLRLFKKPVVIVGQAMSDHAGTETMFVDEPGSAKNTLNRKWVDTLRTDSVRFGKTLDFQEKTEVETSTIEELIRLHGRPFISRSTSKDMSLQFCKASAVPFPIYHLK
jgi:FkbM family methyltransferase